MPFCQGQGSLQVGHGVHASTPNLLFMGPILAFMKALALASYFAMFPLMLTVLDRDYSAPDYNPY